jgi:AcrR family transcriptional regulator
MNMTGMDGRRGRPRSGEVGAAILEAARNLVLRHGYRAVTTRMIAAEAGAGKQSLYRRWRSKAELVLDAFLEQARIEIDERTQEGAPSDLRQTLASFLVRTFEALDRSGPAIRTLMALAQEDPELLRSLRDRLVEPRRRALAAAVSAAIGDERRRAACDIDGAVMLAYGALWYRLLLDEPLDEALAHRIAGLIVDGIGGPGQGNRRASAT